MHKKEYHDHKYRKPAFKPDAFSTCVYPYSEEIAREAVTKRVIAAANPSFSAKFLTDKPRGLFEMQDVLGPKP